VVAFACCDVWGHGWGNDENWIEPFADQLGQLGNIEEDPAFCGTGNESCPVCLQGASPCAPRQYGCQQGMGAWPVDLTCEYSAVEGEGRVPQRLLLFVSTPFRVGEGTSIRLGIPATMSREAVELRIQDVTGRLVRRIGLGPLSPGMHSVAWDGANGKGQYVPAGVYFCCLGIGGRLATERLVVVR
jgi:hypothetical protein